MQYIYKAIVRTQLVQGPILGTTLYEKFKFGENTEALYWVGARNFDYMESKVEGDSTEEIKKGICQVKRKKYSKYIRYMK